MERKVLLVLQRRTAPAKAAEIKVGKAADRDAALASLVAAGLVAATLEGKVTLHALTPAGALAAAEAAAPVAGAAEKKPRARKVAPPAAVAADGPTLASLEERLVRIEALLLRLAAVGAPAAPVDVSVLKPSVLQTVTELDARCRYGGVVPIPVLRQELRRTGVQAADADVDAALLSLERDFVIDLLVAQSPATVPDRSLGIERAGRGLVYYVAPRVS